jgi:cellulose synthase/poly-beta-1,6-N-acetylglucosamine synthase-like glycosyltransferase
MVRNFGFQKAKYSIVVIMDDDCIPEKNWLNELIGEFDTRVTFDDEVKDSL